MKNSLLLIASSLVVISCTSCNKNGGHPPKSVTATSSNADVVISDQEMTGLGMYLIHVKCNTENMYFRKSMYVTDYKVTIGKKEARFIYPNKRISLNEVEFLFNTDEIGNQDVNIDCTLQSANREFSEAEFTGRFRNDPPLKFIPFTISAYEKEKIFQVEKIKNIECLTINVSCGTMMEFYGNIGDIQMNDWNSLEVGGKMNLTFKWYSDNDDFGTGPITFYGNPN